MLNERLRTIIKKEFRQTLREPRMRVMLFMPPLLQLLIFGYAVNLDVDSARIAWMDEDRTPQSRSLLAEFVGSGHFEIDGWPTSEREMQGLLDRSKVDGIVRVLPGFARDVQRGRSTSIQVLVDGTNSNTATIVQAYASQAVARYAGEAMSDIQRNKVVGATLAAGGAIHPAVPQIEAASRVWFNPDLKSKNYFVPAVIVNILMLVTLSLTAMSIVREKEIGTMEQLMVTPIRPVELILGKTLPFVFVGFVDMLVAVGAALVIFHVPFVGSFGLLCLAAFCFILTTLGAGLFISTISATQQQANMATFLMFQPFMMLSGFSFPIRNMPQAIQYFTLINPMRYFMEVVRGIFLKGAGFDALWPQIAALGGLGLIVLTSAVLRFRKQIE